ncbi:unnamed protein product [Oppiella nova]|uniref:Protein UXT n=1 Tax=Oppiella nova TaxID=334625 RepID=A0A7R9MD44_9ACAR|nr:unnamed protein product [Oppiella nova]CAG2174975.1 unnamed protein product [Oppiella nova]
MSSDAAKSDANEVTVAEKVTKYEHFVNDVLREDLKRVLLRQELICQQMAQYLQLKAVFQGVQRNRLVDDCEDKPLKMQTDIGSNFYVQTVIANPRKVFLMIGMGFYVELTLEEALAFIDKRQTHLNEELNQLSTQSSKIKANINSVHLSLLFVIEFFIGID